LPVPIPATPKILPTQTPYKISWQGSTGASGYIIERKDRYLLFFSRWIVIDSNASDANIGYRPLFADSTAEPGVNYSYRISAKNISGISEPSEPFGPVQAPYRLMIDEFENSNRMVKQSAGVSYIYKDAIRAKEDWSRISGTSNDYIVYHLPECITSIQLDAFFTDASQDSNLTFSSGTSLESLMPLPSSRTICEVFKNEYRFFKPVRYSTAEIPPEHRYVKILLMDGIQLGRLEIGYDPE
jgi:hypothetical protein